jgi:hypothetical protein
MMKTEHNRWWREQARRQQQQNPFSSKIQVSSGNRSLAAEPSEAGHGRLRTRTDERRRTEPQDLSCELKHQTETQGETSRDN